MNAAAVLEGPEAPLTTGLVPLILMCGLLVWIVFARAWESPRREPPWTEPDLSDQRACAAYARSIADHPSGLRGRPQDVVCRFCGVPADPRVTGEWGLCMAVESWDKAAADQVTIDQAGYGS